MGTTDSQTAAPESCQFHTARIHRMQNAHAMAQKWLCHLVAATAATAAASAATGGGGRFCGSSIAGAVCGCEDGKLNAGLLAGALGAGDFLLLIDDNLLKAGFALFANVFIDGHGGCSFDLFRRFGVGFDYSRRRCIRRGPLPHFVELRILNGLRMEILEVLLTKGLWADNIG